MLLHKNPGVTATESTTVRTYVGFSSTLSASIGMGAFSASATAEYRREVETTNTTKTTEENTSLINFTAPAGKLYRVLQAVVKFDSPIPSDDCELRCMYTIEEIGEDEEEEEIHE